MSVPLRSKQGCWTCRLRKKKCDEGASECHICVNLSITCYGYGPKPHWMDGGENEQNVANGIKNIVKYTPRRRTTTSAAKPTRNTKLAPRISVPQRAGPAPEDFGNLNDITIDHNISETVSFQPTTLSVG